MTAHEFQNQTKDIRTWTQYDFSFWNFVDLSRSVSSKLINYSLLNKFVPKAVHVISSK